MQDSKSSGTTCIHFKNGESISFNGVFDIGNNLTGFMSFDSVKDEKKYKVTLRLDDVLYIEESYIEHGN